MDRHWTWTSLERCCRGHPPPRWQRLDHPAASLQATITSQAPSRGDPSCQVCLQPLSDDWPQTRPHGDRKHSVMCAIRWPPSLLMLLMYRRCLYMLYRRFKHEGPSAGARPAAVSDAAGADSGAHLSLRCGPLLISAEVLVLTEVVQCMLLCCQVLSCSRLFASSSL